MKNLKTRIAVLAAASATVFASGALTATTAQAATGWNRCPAGYFCVFDGHNGTGLMAYFQWGSPNLADQGMNNKTSSFWNRTNRWWVGRDGYNYSGHATFSASPGHILNIPTTWYANNRTSSLKAS
uniref:peptidase inhibitor family I36 protein n=1 Tax=Actinomadura sp. CA-154981 TaxID=3240037 RepID=UPI003F491418